MPGCAAALVPATGLSLRSPRTARGAGPAPRRSGPGSREAPTPPGRRKARGLRNLGVDCDKSGLLVIDEDTPDAFGQYARSTGEVLPVTFTVTTGKGRHIYFRQPPGIPLGNRTGALSGRGIDVRGRGGYVVAPGSVHHTGPIYTPAEATTPAAPAPGWLITALHSQPPTRSRSSAPIQGSPHGRLRGAVGIVLTAVPGERNNRLHWAACRAAEMIAARQLDQAAAIHALTQAGETVGLSPGEIHATIASALRTATT